MPNQPEVLQYTLQRLVLGHWSKAPDIKDLETPWGVKGRLDEPVKLGQMSEELPETGTFILAALEGRIEGRHPRCVASVASKTSRASSKPGVVVNVSALRSAKLDHSPPVVEAVDVAPPPFSRA